MDNYFSSKDILDKAIGTDAYFQIKSILFSLKAADVAEVKHGRWITEICESISKRNRLIEYKVYSCSVSGRSNGARQEKVLPKLRRFDEGGLTWNEPQ